MSEDIDGFDPDAYLKAKLMQADTFDPDAYLAEKAQAARKPPPQVGPKETFVNDFLEMVPLGRTATNVLSTAAMKAFGLDGGGGVELTDQAKRQLRAMGKEPVGPPGLLELYRQVRNERAERTQAGAAQNPIPSLLGKGTGFLASMAAPLPKVAPFKAAGLAGRLGNAAATGATYGAIGSAERGSGDLAAGDVGQFISDVSGVEGLGRAGAEFSKGNYLSALGHGMGAGALGGAGGGALVGGAVEWAQKAGLGELLKRLAIRKGKDVLQGGSDIASPTRKPLSDDAVEEVLRSNKMGGTTAETYAGIEDEAAKAGQEYAKIVQGLEERGVRGPEAKNLADKLMQRYREEWVVAPANKAVPQAYLDEAENLLTLTGPPPGAQGPAHTSLGLGQGERLKQHLQNQARYERLANNPSEEARQEIASMVRQANEDSISAAAQKAGPGSETAELASRFVPIKKRLGNLLEARTAAERGAVKAEARSSGPGLPDYLLGAASGNPATAYLTALASKSFRSRFPAFVSGRAYNASQSMANGGAGATLSRYLQMGLDHEPTEEEKRAALIEALQAPR